MSLPIKKVANYEYVATERIYLDAKREKIVSEKDKEASFLLAAEGQIIPFKEVKRLKLDEKLASVKPVEPEPEKPEPEKPEPEKARTHSPEDIKSRATR